MPKVLIVTPWFPWPDTPIRGIWAIDHARALQREHEVALLTFRPDANWPGSEHGRGFELSDEVEDGLRTFRITYPSPRLPGLGMVPVRRGTHAALDRLEADGFIPDVIHAHIFLAAPAALPAARRSGAPLVILENLSRIVDHKLSPLENLLARRTYRAAAIVCPTNRPLAEEVRKLGARTVVPMENVLDVEQFHPPASRRVPSGELQAIAVGSLLEKKGHRHLLDSMPSVIERIPGFRLQLVGDGPLRGELEAQADELGISERIEWPGYLTLEQLAVAMRAADIHVLPSLRENLPLVVAEAMATGIPTVGTRVGGVPEMLEGGAGLIVERGDPRALADAIVEMSESLDDYDPATIAALSRERYGYEALGRRWGKLYESVISR